MTETVSNFDCKKCGQEHMLFIDEKKFFCPSCGNEWELTELGMQLLRGVE